MATESVLNVLNEELEKITNIQADISASGSAADSQLLEIGRVLNDLSRLKQRAKAEKEALDRLDKKVMDAAEEYFTAIQPVREALGSEGELAVAVRDSRKEAILAALGLTELEPEKQQEELNNLLEAVHEYDSDKDVDTAEKIEKKARQALIGFLESEVAQGARTVHEEAKAALERAGEAILGLAQEAKVMVAAAKSDLAQLDEALDNVNPHPYKAVIHLSDLLQRCEQLEAPVTVTVGEGEQQRVLLADPHGFEATQEDGEALETAVNAAWDQAKRAYIKAVEDLYGKEAAEGVEGTKGKKGEEVIHLLSLIALAKAKADAEHREAVRLSGAAEKVEEAHTGTDDGNGDGGGGGASPEEP